MSLTARDLRRIGPKNEKRAASARGNRTGVGGGPGDPGLYRPEHVVAVKKLKLMSATDAMIADFFGVDTGTFILWLKKHPEFKAAYDDGGIIADALVAERQHERACGYNFTAMKIFVRRHGSIVQLPEGERVETTDEVILVPYSEHVPADVGAGQFWLRNRQGDLWKEKSYQESKGSLEITGTGISTLLAAVKKASAE